MTRSLHLFRAPLLCIPVTGPARHGRQFALWVALVLSLHAGAEAQAKLLGSDGLAGGRQVGSAFAGAEPGAASLSLQYAHTENVIGARDAHERMAGNLGGGYAFRRWLALSAAFAGRFDMHRHPQESGLATSTRIATRHAFDLGPRAAVALATGLTFPAAGDLARGFSALTPELSALASYAPFKAGELSLLSGYRLDRTRYAVKNPSQLSPPDRLAAELANYDSVLLGALLAGRINNLAWSAEWSWDVAVGKHAPSAIDSPMRVTAGLQATLGRVILGGFAGASPSGRPVFRSDVRIEPRYWLGLSCGLWFGAQKPLPAKVVSVPQAPQKAESPSVSMVLRVSDANGAAIPGARLSYSVEGEPSSLEADPAGRITLTGREGSQVKARLQADDFVAQDLDLTLSAGGELAFTLERALPDGEIKGKVRSLRGGPLVATIEVVELQKSVTSGPDGTFRIDVPPGAYTLRISAAQHETQQRAVQVERLGVAILVIDLRRLSR
jgi:hypothetical protein